MFFQTFSLAFGYFLANFEVLVLGWLAGKPNYPQKLKVPEGYEKINEIRNI